MMLTHAEIEDLINSKPHWTYSDLKLLPEDFHCELLYNKIYMSPSPFTEHQRVIRKLSHQLSQFVENAALGEVFFAPFDVVLNQDNVVQPDLVFIETDQMKQLKNHFFGVPTLVAEVLSASTAKYDKTTKKELYEKFGVKEYWIVDVYNGCIELFSPDKSGKYQLTNIFSAGEVFESVILKGFRVEIDAILPPLA